MSNNSPVVYAPIAIRRGWVPFDESRPDDNDWVMYYIPDFSLLYRVGIGSDYDIIKLEYPGVTHWTSLLAPPTGN